MLKSTLLPFLQTFASQLNAVQHVLSPSSSSSSCTQLQFSAFEPVINGPVSIASNISSQLAAPQLVAGLNSSAGEQWAFDATSADGTSGLLIGFYHDPTYAFLGPGNLRLSLDAVWPNGSTWSLVDYLSQADIDMCAQGTTGVWSKKQGAISSSYSFSIAADNSLATLEFYTPRLQGSISIKSSVPARVADGSFTNTLLNTTAPPPSTFNAPALHWSEPIPAGRAIVDLILDGSPLRWDGMGGAERWWAGQGWLDVLQGWRAVRAVVGPYVLTYWAPKSRLNAGTLYPSAFLARNGKKIFHATRSGPSLDSTTNQEPYIEYRGIPAETPPSSADDNGGASTTKTNNKNNHKIQNQNQNNHHQRDAIRGYIVHLVSPRESRRWEFTLTHRNLEFEFDLGDGSGGVAYVGTAAGGEFGDDVYQGVFFNEWVDVTGLKVPGVYVWAARWVYWVWARVRGF